MKPSGERDSAEALALHALAFVVGDEDRLRRFQFETGATADTLRAAAIDPLLLGAVLDFLLAYDDRLLAFAEYAKVKPLAITAARRRLPGANPEL